MNRANTVYVSLCIAGCCLPAPAQQDFSSVQIKTTKVAGNVYVLEGSGGNIGVSVGEDGILIVDDQYAPLSEKIRAALRALGHDKPRFILNTHWHGDHVGGNAAFGSDGTIIAHTNVRDRVTTRQVLFGRAVEPLPPVALPVVTFDDAITVHFNGEPIRLVHYPTAHTDGDSAVFFTKSNVVHTGDLLFMGMFPFVDLDHGGDVDGLIRAVEDVLRVMSPDARVIPGHGPVTDRGGLQAFHDMLVDTTGVVRAGIQAGTSLNEIQATGVPDKWKSWDGGFIKSDQWIETIHKSLSR
jgi:glyoxylase-like metal-dependent hydrolase (beta-lactamase superfamily II)